MAVKGVLHNILAPRHPSFGRAIGIRRTALSDGMAGGLLLERGWPSKTGATIAADVAVKPFGCMAVEEAARDHAKEFS